MELFSIVLEQVEDNDQTREVVRLASGEGPEVRLCCLSFQKRFLNDFFLNKFLKDSPLLVPAAEDRLEVELHNLSPSLQVVFSLIFSLSVKILQSFPSVL